MTPSEVETAARQRLNAVSSDFWSSTEIIGGCLYFALMDLITRAKLYEATTTDTSVSGTSAYSKPTGAIEIKQITYDGQKLELMPERQYFALNLAGTAAATGRPTHYYLWGSQYILYPTPDTSSLTISIRYISEPGAMTAVSTIPIPLQYHPRLVNGVAYYMLLKEVADPRIPVFEARWMRDVQDTIDEWKRSKYADRNAKVRLEEISYTTDTGMV